MCNQIRAALCVLLTAISGSLHPATGQSCSLPETMNLNYVSGISWSCRDKTLPCKPKAELLRAEEIKSGETPIGVLRSCDRDAPPQGRLIVSRTDQTFPLQSPQVLQAEASAPSTLKLSCYKMDELLDYHQELGSAQIKLEPREIFPVQRVRTGFPELSLPAPLKVVPDRESRREKSRVQVTVAIIATENALRMAPLASWEAPWGSDPRDASIDREVLWISISLDGKLEIQQTKPVKTFGILTPPGKRPLKDTGALEGKPVLKKIAEFLGSQATEDLQKLDYVIFLKEGWAPSLEGVEALSTQLARLRPDATFDIVSAQTITNERGILQSLATDREGGRYFESVVADRIEIPGQDFGGRVLGRIRHQADAKARALGIELVPSPIDTATVAVKLDEVPFELGNLATPEQVSMMISVLELALCLSSREEIEVPLALLTAISRAGLSFQRETTLGELFRSWFSGFELPQESPLGQWTFLDLIREARQPERKALLDKILRELRKLPQRDTNCALFVPSSLFLQRK